MKKLLILLFALLSINLVQAEEFPPSGQGIHITKETNPIYWGYLEDYGARLKAALDKKRMFKLKGVGASWEFVITKDGQIKDMTLPVSKSDYFHDRFKDIILSVPPEPFREGMNLDEMDMDVFLGFKKYNDIYISIGSSFKSNKKSFGIMILTNK